MNEDRKEQTVGQKEGEKMTEDVKAQKEEGKSDGVPQEEQAADT